MAGSLTYVHVRRYVYVRKRISATEAVDHPFLELANHRGLGNRIMLDRHRAYMFRRKWEVRCRFLSNTKQVTVLLMSHYAAVSYCLEKREVH